MLSFGNIKEFYVNCDIFYKLNDKYTYKAFLWNGENNAPLCDALTIVNN